MAFLCYALVCVHNVNGYTCVNIMYCYCLRFALMLFVLGNWINLSYQLNYVLFLSVCVCVWCSTLNVLIVSVATVCCGYVSTRVVYLGNWMQLFALHWSDSSKHDDWWSENAGEWLMDDKSISSRFVMRLSKWVTKGKFRWKSQNDIVIRDDRQARR